MEILRGKQVAFMDAQGLAQQRAGYASIHIDIGTGDGRFVRHSAQSNAAALVIGLDACRENLHDAARRAPANALFVIANAQALPVELHGLAHQITINFPWGSLLEGLLTENEGLMHGLCRLAQSQAALTICLNGGALHEAGWALEAGAKRVQEVVRAYGFAVTKVHPMTARDLRAYPTTWAKRLAYGRDPRAVCIQTRKATSG